PFTADGKQEDVRLRVPAEQRILFNKRRWLPTGKKKALTNADKEYISGTCPVLRDICNDMFIGGKLDVKGKPFHGVVMTDTVSGKSIYNEVDDKYRFWIIWNHEGKMGYFCPEPMTAQVNAPNMDQPADITGYEEIGPDETYTAVQRFYTEG
ncbi:MAG: aldose 1-epimerase, partial [Oscillospiraceae bacterium]|nr:aldose 1-epimerase [Oscillospiraceae bacterium]